MSDITKWGEYLHQAKNQITEVDYIKKQMPELSIDLAYKIQDKGIELREKDGEKVIALKMGLTSEAKRAQMNLFSAIYGVLTDKMQIKENGAYNLNYGIHPKIEPEIAFYISNELNASATESEIRNACTEIAPALEILDSRFKSFKYFSLEDVIADNASSSHFILGPAEPWDGKRDLKGLSMKMKVDGEVVQEGSSEAISGDPFQSIVEQVNLLGQRDLTIPAGTWILAGAATPAYPLTKPCEVSLEVEGLGNVIAKIVKE